MPVHYNTVEYISIFERKKDYEDIFLRSQNQIKVRMYRNKAIFKHINQWPKSHCSSKNIKVNVVKM